MCAELAFGTPTLFFELLDAVTIPAAQPASLPELRVNAAAGRERLVMKQPRRATAVLGVLLALLRCVIGPAVPAPLTAAIVNGQNFRDSSTRIIGIAPLAAVAAETSHCSSASPCWLCASEKIEVLDGGAQLASIDSIKLLGYYTSGKGSESMCPADASQKNKVAHDERKLRGQFRADESSRRTTSTAFKACRRNIPPRSAAARTSPTSAASAALSPRVRFLARSGSAARPVACSVGPSRGEAGGLRLGSVSLESQVSVVFGRSLHAEGSVGPSAKGTPTLLLGLLRVSLSAC